MILRYVAEGGLGRIITEQQLRKPPAFLNPARGQLNNLLNMPSAYFRFSSQMLMLCMHYGNGEPAAFAYGAFEEPDYARLASLNEEEIVLFLEELGKIIWTAYDVEWWFILKERAFQRRKLTGWTGFDNVPLELGFFPATVDEYREWIAGQSESPLL